MTSSGAIDVRYVEVDLPPVMVGLHVHIVVSGRCMAGIITELRYNSEAVVEPFPAPNATLPVRDVPYRFEPGGQGHGTFHRLMECPSLPAIAAGWAGR